MTNKYLTWQGKLPTRPGLYIRTNGHGRTELVHASVEHFLNGTKTVRLTDVTADFVPGAVTVEPAGLTYQTGETFLGPILLPRPPRDGALKRALPELPREPGIYFLSRDLGHAWLHELVAVSVHRYMVCDTPHDELFAVSLPSLEVRKLEKQLWQVLTLALPHHRKLNLQQLPARRRS